MAAARTPPNPKTPTPKHSVPTNPIPQNPLLPLRILRPPVAHLVAPAARAAAPEHAVGSIGIGIPVSQSVLQQQHTCKSTPKTKNPYTYPPLPPARSRLLLWLRERLAEREADRCLSRARFSFILRARLSRSRRRELWGCCGGGVLVVVVVGV